MASATVTPADTFRIPFWRMYFPAAVYAQVGFAPLMWLQFYLLSRNIGGLGQVHVVLYALGAAAVAGLLVPAFLVYVAVLKVRVSPDGFTCSNGLGKRVTVSWGSITGARRLSVPGFPYLIVYSSESRFKLWLPLFLGRFAEFADKVEEYAGADHVLYRHVWRRAEAE